jgi:crossover junction endodeoxyribonuclease RuvC
MTTTFIGIDPGLSGAIAVISSDADKGEWPHLYDMPVINDGKKNHVNIPELLTILRDWNPKETEVVIEEVGAMPGQGVTSMFRMGQTLGILHCAIVACGFPMHRVRPQEWKKTYGMAGKDKPASILRAQELFPHADIKLKKHDGRAEALLMAEYLRRLKR